MMRFYLKSSLLLLLCVALLSSACVKEIPVAEQAEKVLVVNAFLETGSAISQVHLSTLDTGEGMQQVSGLRVHVSDGEQSILLSENPSISGNYVGDDSFVIQEGRQYHLELLWNDELVTATTKSTPLLENLDVSKLFIDTHVEDDLLFLEWESVNQGSFNEYFYVVTAKPLEDPEFLESINRSSGLEYSPRILGLTYNPELTLMEELFYYYGEHLVEIRAVNKVHEAFFMAQMDYTLNAPGNISGAAGFFIGTSVLSTVIDIR